MVIFGAHRPVGMPQRLLGRRLRGSASARPGAERPARRGEDDAAHVLAPARRPAPGTARCARNSTGRMVAPRGRRRRMNSPPAQTRHSLLASATVAPRCDRGERRLQPGRAGDRRHHPIGRPLRGLDEGRLARARPRCPMPASASLSSRHRRPGRRPPRSGRRARARAAPSAARCAAPSPPRRGSGRRSRRSRSMVLAPIEPVAPSSVTLRAGVGRGRRWLQVVRILDACGASRLTRPADPRAGASRPPRAQADQRSRETAADEAVEPVHQAAMAGNECAGVLGAEPPLDRRFEQVAGLRQRPTARARRSPTAASPLGAEDGGDREHRRPRWPRRVPPSAPDQVFFGLTRGTSFGPPIARPAK